MVDSYPLSYKGRKPTAAMLVEVWTKAEERFPNRDRRIRQCRDLRRGTEAVTLDATFLMNHPEIKSDWVVSKMPEREGYDRDVATKAASIEPTIAREPLDVTDTARDQAEEYEAYMREVAADEENGVPYATVIEKLTEDGEVGMVTLPSELDSGGLPDFYERLTERAVKKLDPEARKAYSKDDNDRRGRYVKRDERGRRTPNPRYDRDVKGRRRADAEKADGAGSFTRDSAKSRAAHDGAVRRYLLAHSASTFRIIPAPDCYPLLGRGRGRSRWNVEGIIERALLSREELIERKMGWAMLGNRLILPRGVTRTQSSKGGDFYLYTLYTSLWSEEDGCYHPCVLYCVGGAATWWDGYASFDTGDREAIAKADEVAIIDLYEECGLTGAFWAYEFGLHTADDDPDWYGRPAIYQFRSRILNIESIETANNAANSVEAYGGSYYKPDAALLAVDPEAVVEPETHTVRKPVRPLPGEIQPWAGDVIPVNKSEIGPDAWRQLANLQASLRQAMAVEDRMERGASGHAMLVAGQQGLIAKDQIRSAALRLYKFCLESDALIRLGAYKRHNGVKWPILTSKERPVGHEIRTRTTPVEFNPDWLGEDENPKLKVSYGAEFNLARADQEMAAAERGFRGLKHVAEAFGEDDVMGLRVEIARDAMWRMPENQLLLQSIVDSLRGMKKQRQAAMLQAQQRMTTQALPGAQHGVPTAMVNGQQQPSGGGPTIGSSVRGGIVSAEKTGAALEANAMGQMGAA